MNWIDYEETKPKKDGYYLCAIWVDSHNSYFPSTDFEVLYCTNGEFKPYPILESNNGVLCEHHKVTWYTEISRPPIKKRSK